MKEKLEVLIHDEYIDGTDYDELNWRPIPGFGGWYDISRDGEIRSWKKSNHGRRETPRKLKASYSKCGAMQLALSDEFGRSLPYKVAHLMAKTWMGGIPDGMYVYHKNGDVRDNTLNNLVIAPKAKAYKEINKRSAVRHCVAKVSKDGEIIEVYPSAAEAARKNFLCKQQVLEHCKKRIQNPFKFLDFTFAYDRGLT